MDNALSDWLALREAADAVARSGTLIRTIAAALPARRPMQALDLATGTGSNIRYLAERLPDRQRWLAVDRSATLLAHLLARMSSWAAARRYDVSTEANTCMIRGDRLDCQIETRQLDLGTLDDNGIFAGRDLVTASALLDLVSERWLRSLAVRCRAAGAAALFTLTYNGHFSCSPMEREDDMVRDHFNRHQRTDKGLGGPAAGPDAADGAVRCFVEAGYQVQIAPSDWVLDARERGLQQGLIDGWARAAAEIAPGAASAIAGWRVRRLGHVEAGRSRVVVGHQDLAAWPNGKLRN